MRIRFESTTAAVLLLAGVAALNAFIGLGSRLDLRLPPPPNESSMRYAALGSQGRLVLERCREDVSMIHDVSWAAACMSNGATDDSPECTLPEQRAAALNAARAAAEEHCLDEAAEAESRHGRSGAR